MTSPGNRGKDGWIRCNTCRTRRRTFALLAQHYKSHPQCQPCNCGLTWREGGTQHRRGTRFCVAHPMVVYDTCRRAGESHVDAMVEQAFARPGVFTTEPPF